ncbi:MAG: hypothetical protein ACSW8H_08620, partial [bacterium]
ANAADSIGKEIQNSQPQGTKNAYCGRLWGKEFNNFEMFFFTLTWKSVKISFVYVLTMIRAAYEAVCICKRLWI